MQINEHILGIVAYRAITNLVHDKSDAAFYARLEKLFSLRGVQFPRERFSPGRLRLRDGVHLQLEIIDTPKPKGVIVFMPGTNAYVLLYADLLVALANAGYAVVGFDPRGHGRSEGARGSYTIPELVADMREVIGFARARYACPVFASGSSQGGITSFYIAATDENIAGALCHNVADLADPESIVCTRLPPWMGKGRALLDWLAQRFPELPVPMSFYLNLVKEKVRGVGSAWDLILLDPTLVPYVRLKTMASLGRARLARPIQHIQTPVFVLHGGDDQIFPEPYIRRVFDRLTCEKEIYVVDGVPHYMVVDYVDAYRERLVRWLDKMTLRAGQSHLGTLRSTGAA